MNAVEEMAIASGLPKPRVWIVPDSDPNAFATGRDAATASVAVTEGLLATLSRDELQAVVAHEMAHVRNLDVRLMTLLAGMIGAIALLSDGMGRMIGRGGRAGALRAGGRRGSGKGNPLGVLILVLWLLTLVVAPMISRLLAMAVSRKREYLADATGAQLTRNPMALASALEKLEGATAATASISQGAAHLCIVDPSPGLMSSREGFLADFVASHPPIRQRIVRLHGMAYQQAKRETAGAGSPP
jgi:heat shock protein HtpX